MATVDLGKVRITFGGPFNSSQAYEKLTIVDGPFNVKYISTKDVPAGSSLSDANYWTPLSGQFVEQYQGSHSTNPATRNDGSALQVGDLYFDTSINEMRVYNGSVWRAAGSTVNGTSKRQTFTGDGTTTTFTVTGGYDANFADVYLNGVKLVNGQDVDVSSGTNVVFTTAPAAGDVIDVVAYGSFQLADMYTKAEIDQGQVVLNAIKKVDGAGSGLDADTLDGLNASQFLRSDVEDGYTPRVLRLTDSQAEISLDTQDAPDGKGSKRITCNDGGGNLNVRCLSYFSSGADRYVFTGSGATHIKHMAEAVDGSINLRVAKKGTAGTTINWTSLDITPYGLHFDGHKVWHEGDAAASLVGNGYQKLPSGLIIQWGSIGATSDANGYATYSFPLAFPNACLSVSCVDTGTACVDYGVTSLTATTFTVYLKNSDGSVRTNASTGVKFIAIGY